MLSSPSQSWHSLHFWTKLTSLQPLRLAKVILILLAQTEPESSFIAEAVSESHQQSTFYSPSATNTTSGAAVTLSGWPLINTPCRYLVPKSKILKIQVCSGENKSGVWKDLLDYVCMWGVGGVGGFVRVCVCVHIKYLLLFLQLLTLSTTRVSLLRWVLLANPRTTSRRPSPSLTRTRVATSRRRSSSRHIT